MYSKEEVELFLLAIDEGMRVSDAADFAGVKRRAAKSWAAGNLPHSYTGKPRRMSATEKARRKARPMPTKGIYDPPKSGPLAGLNPDQIENLLLRAVLADLKAGGWDPASISNRSKCELGERLRRETGLPLRSITGFLRISKSSYEYQRARLACRRDRDADIRPLVRELFDAENGARGYRAVHARMRRAGVVASEKRVRRVMREEGLRSAYAKRRRKGYSSYAGEVSKAPPNLVGRDFHASTPDELWLTDITEFRLPSGGKVYLSPVIDCFDGRPAAWSIGRRPGRALANSSLEKAVAQRRPGQEHVCEGVQSRQRGVRGVLWEAEERVLPPSGLVGRGHRCVHVAAGRLHGILLRGAHQGVPGLDESERVPQEPGLRLVGGPGKRPHPLGSKSAD